MEVDHIGYAVKNIEKAKTVFENLGFVFEVPVDDKDRNIIILFGNNGNTRIELIQILDADAASPVTEILKKNGPTPYHICYKTENIDEEIRRLSEEKWILISQPQRAVAFDAMGRIRVAFLLHRSIGLIELVEIPI